MLNTTINGYKILRYIDKGGMAEVWYAENRLGKPAAIKILLSKFCDDKDIVDRFENEAKLMVALKHDHIRSVFDYGELEGRPCIIMEYLDGESLSKIMALDNRIPQKQFIQWWNEMASVLNYTHNSGVIHRDIKPSNIFITRDGQLKLLDFGIAKIKEGINMTMTGQGLGTMIYMSPEQIRDPKRVTHQTDTYSLSVTFFHLLTGKLPYDRTSTSDYEIQTKIVNEPLDLSLLPLSWRNFLGGYLHKDPAKRMKLAAFPNSNENTVIATTEIGPDIPDNDQTTIIDRPKMPKNDDRTVVQPIGEDKNTVNKSSNFTLFSILFIAAISCLMPEWGFISLRLYGGTSSLITLLLCIIIGTMGVVTIIKFFKRSNKVKINMDQLKPFFLSDRDNKIIQQSAILYSINFAAELFAIFLMGIINHPFYNYLYYNPIEWFPEYLFALILSYIVFLGAAFSKGNRPYSYRRINVIMTAIVILHLLYFLQHVFLKII